MTLAMRYAARSDVGLLRDGNEDSLYAGPRLLAIADGMGGQVAGEVASSAVIATIAHLDEDTPGSDLLGTLDHALAAANDRLRRMISDDRQLDGMGTTLTAMLVDGGRVGVVHIGDSRGYLLRDGELTRITRDHSLVQTLVDEGRISADEAAHHPQRSLILKALDGRVQVEPDLSVRELHVGDRYLLCTDGLTDVVTEPTIRDTLSAAGSPREAVDRLIDLALRGGGPDNVTCLVADVVDGSGTTDVVVAGAAADNELRPPSPDTPAGRAAALAATAPSSDLASGEDQPAATRRRRWHPGWRFAVIVAAVVVVVGGALLATHFYLRAQYYVGDESGEVAILRGVSGSFLGVSLHSVESRTGIQVGNLPQFQRERVEQGINAASLTAAQGIVRTLNSQQCSTTAIQTSPNPTPTGQGGSKQPGPAPVPVSPCTGATP